MSNEIVKCYCAFHSFLLTIDVCQVLVGHNVVVVFLHLPWPIFLSRTILTSSSTLYMYNELLWWRWWQHHIKTFCSWMSWSLFYADVFVSPLWPLESLFVEEMSTAEVESFRAADKPSASSCAALPPGPMKGILIGQGMSVSWNNECWISSMAASLFSLAGRLNPEDLGNRKKLARFLSVW